MYYSEKTMKLCRTGKQAVRKQGISCAPSSKDDIVFSYGSHSFSFAIRILLVPFSTWAKHRFSFERPFCKRRQLKHGWFHYTLCPKKRPPFYFSDNSRRMANEGLRNAAILFSFYGPLISQTVHRRPGNSISGVGPASGTKITQALRHLFCNSGVEVRDLASIFHSSRLWVALVWTRKDISKIKKISLSADN